MLVVETNIDDMSPELLGARDRSGSSPAGAVDVTLVPVQMKKGRPGVLLQVLAARERRDDVAAALFAETTTIGVRFHAVGRADAPSRAWSRSATPYGADRGQDRDGAGGCVDCAGVRELRAAAAASGVPLRVVRAARRAVGWGALRRGERGEIEVRMRERGGTRTRGARVLVRRADRTQQSRGVVA